ncbi:N-6 DNA methylase [Maridesulfovibrio sp.]|uniref:HsdM family class I SAM-dependent methyltransferase n=1 Tax=Maridesulfovibrio sp. TaxID=2795000 RepID=UPI002AA8BD9C|nr:N-6 DNA methylase [Maridesulfovibrio sp.]
MNQYLANLHLTQETAPPGLEKVSNSPSTLLPLDEQIAIRQAYFLCSNIDYIFFRRFSDGRSSQVAAYVVVNADETFSQDQIKDLHHELWLSGATPLLYVDWNNHVDIFSCAAGKTVTNKNEWKYSPAERIEIIGDIATGLDQCQFDQYSSYRLADGTFWEDKRNLHLIDRDNAAHKVLIDKVKMADRKLEGSKNPAARRLLLLTLLIKYLEDRGVFPSAFRNWFSTYHENATSFLDVLKSANVDSVRKMFLALQNKFNGDIFTLDQDAMVIDESTLRKLAEVVEANYDSKGQLYFWDIYSFKHIPVEVLSHIYQYFADKDNGAVFTPPFLVNLLLDQILPLKNIQGDETVLDPTCGSGVFLVAAFRRLIYAWLSKNNWKRPTPQILKKLLKNTIFGIEIQEEAVHLTAFSLALAICDALQPEIIWNDLRFDTMIEQNLFVGDFAHAISRAIQKTSGAKGFDVIIGNPPFKSKMTTAMRQSLESMESIPDKQIAYYILKRCCQSYLAKSGKACLIQPAGVLYNEKTQQFRAELFESVQIDTVLDFVSIRGLFEGADPKIVALLVTSKNPDEDHRIKHWTFRRTQTAKGRISFELDYYDHHYVSLDDARSIHWIWRANLLGGGRALNLAKKLSQLPTLSDEVARIGCKLGEGYIAGDKKAKHHASWLTGKQLLETTTFKSDAIDPCLLSTVKAKLFDTPYSEERFRGPLVLIKENANLPCAYWDEGALAYKDKIIGIYGQPQHSAQLQQFRNFFISNRRKLKASCFLLGSQILVGKATAPLMSEICRLPWPVDNEWALAPWEEEIIHDINDYLAEYVRRGQTSKLLTSSVDKTALNTYQATFLRVLRSVFPKVSVCGSEASNGLLFQAFSFEGNATKKLIDDGWSEKIKSAIFKSHSETFYTTRIIRLYDEDMLIFIKPDRLRYWIRSTALKDADDVLSDVLDGDH